MPELLTAAVLLAGAKVFHKVADDAVEAFWTKTKSAIGDALKRDARPEDVTPEAVGRILDLRPELRQEAEQVLERDSALRRAKLVQKALDGARVVWIDDHPENNAWERQALEQFGIAFILMTSAEAGEDYVRHNAHDLIVSDIGRGVGRPSGLDALPALRAAAPATPVVFYVGSVKPEFGAPVGAHGITDDPEELLHLVMDCLERARL